MPSVDERVVELEFDNKDFGSRVQQTIGDLKSLDKALQFGGASDGVKEVANAIGKMNLSPMIDAADTVANKFSVLRVIAVSAINRVTNAAMDMGKKLVTAIPNQIIHGGWARASNIAKAKFTIEGILKEGDSWAQLQDDINYGVADTAYGFDAAAMAASSFYASGIQQGDQMKQALRAVSGVAAMTNSEYTDISRIFTTVAGNGRLMGDQLIQLSSRGMNAAAALGEQMHLSEAEVRDMVSKGKISFAEFAKAMDDAFGEHAKDANQTFTGALSNVKAALSRIGAEFAAPLMDAMTPVLNAIRPIINGVKAVLTPVFGDFDTAIHSLSDKAVAFLGVIQKQVDPSLKALTAEDWAKLGDAPYLDIFKEQLIAAGREAAKDKDAFDEMITSAGSFEASLSKGWLTKGVFDKAKTSMSELSGEMEELNEVSGVTFEQLDALAKQVERGDWGNGQERFDRLTEAGWSYHDVQSLVNHDLLGWDYTLESLGTTLKSTGKYTDEQIEAITAFASELEDSGSSLQEFLGIFDSFDKMTTFEYIVESFRNIRGLIGTLSGTTWTSFKDVFDISGLESIPDVIHRITGAFYKFTEGFDAKTILSNFTRVFSTNIFQSIKNVADGIGSIIDQIKIFFNIGKTAFSQVFNGGQQVKFMGIVVKLSNAIVKITESFKNFASGLEWHGKGRGRAVYQALLGFFGSIKSIGSTAQNIIGRLGGAFRTMASALSPLGSIIMSVLGRFTDFSGATDILSVLLGSLEVVIGVIATALTALSDAVSPVVSSFAAWVESSGIVDRAMDRISGAVSKAKPPIDNALRVIQDKFSQFAPIVREKLEGVPDVIQSIFSKIRDHIGPIGETISNAFGGMKDSAFGKVGEAFSGFVDSMAEGHDRLKSIGDLIKSVFETLVDTFEGVVDKITGVKEAVSGVSEGLAAPLEDEASTFQVVVGTISDTFSSLSTMGGSSEGATLLSDFIDVFRNLVDLIKEVSGKDFDELFSYFMQGTAIVGMFKYISAFKGMADAFKGMAGAFKDISKMFKPATSAIDGVKGAITAARPGKFFEFAAGIAAIALSLYLVASIPINDLEKAFGFLAGMVALMAAVLYVIPAIAGKLVKPGDLVQIEGMATAMIAMAGAVFLLALTARMMKGVDPDSVVKLIGIMGILALSMALIGKYTAGVAAGAVSMLAFVAAIVALTFVMKYLGEMKPDVLVQGLASLTFMMIAFATALALIGAFGANPPAVMGILAMAVAVAALTIAIKVLGGMQWDQIATGLGALALGLLAFVAVLVVVGAVIAYSGGTIAAGLVAFGLGALALAAAVLVLVGALWLFSQIDLPTLATNISTAVSIFASMEGTDKAAEAILKLGAATIVAGIGVIALGLGVAVLGLGMLALAAGLGLLGVVAPLAAGGIVMIAGVMPTFAEGCKAAAEGLVPLGGALVVAGLGAVVGAVGLGLLSAAFILAAIAAVAFAAGIKIASMILGGDFISGVAEGANAVFPAVKGLFTNMGKGLMSALSGGGGEGSSGMGKGLLSAFSTNITAELPSVTTSLDGVKGAILGKLNGFDFSGKMGEIGGQLPTDFTTSLSENSPIAMDGMEQLFGSNGDVMSVLDGVDPSTFMGEYAGSYTDSFSESLMSGEPNVDAAMTQVFGEGSPVDLSQFGLDDMASVEGFDVTSMFANGELSGLPEVADASAEVPATVSDNLGDGSEGGTYGNAVAMALQATTGMMAAAAAMMASSAKSSIDALGPQMSTSATTSANGFANGIRGGASGARGAASAIVSSALVALSPFSGKMRSGGSTGGSGFASGVRSQSGAAYSAGSSLSSSAISGSSGGYNSMYSNGASHASGFLSGLQSLMSSISAAAANISKTVARATAKAGEINSPSKVMMRLGRGFTEGFVMGLGKDLDDVKAGGEKMANAVTPAMAKINDAIQAASLSEFDMNPTITPIVNLDNVKAAQSYIDSNLNSAYGLSAASMLGRYNLYGDPGTSTSKSVVNNVSVTVQYQAGSDVNSFASSLASALTAKMNLEA